MQIRRDESQRTADRQLQRIAENAAKNLLPLFEGEATIDEGGRVAVALAAGDTVNSKPIDTALLIERNLDPGRLKQHFIERAPNATRDFSEAETGLYHSNSIYSMYKHQVS